MLVSVQFPSLLFSILLILLSSSSADISTRVQQPGSPVLSSASQWLPTKPSNDTLSAQASLPNLSFRKNEACTSSVSSLLATASLSTTCAESIVGGNDDGSVLFSSCINYTVIPDATKAVKLTTEPYDQFCCGLCTIQYPQAVLFHWPAQRTNTWCDQIRSTLKKEGVAYGGANYPQPAIDPSIYQNAMGLDPEIGGADAFDNEGNLRAPYTRPPESGAYAVAQDGFVFVSPSIYVVFPIILATNNCGVVGNAYTSWTLGVPEHQLSTYQEFYGTQAFNPADLGCPHPLQGRDLNDPGLTEAAEGMDPSVLLPAALTDLDPAWKSCSLLPLGLGRDPPRTLEPAKNMAPRSTSYQASPTVAQGVPYPHALPKSPRPDPTTSSLPTTDDRSSSAVNDTVGSAGARPQKLPSVCSPFLRPHTDLSTSESPPPRSIDLEVSSQRPDIGPRNEAASTTERGTTSGPPISDAAYISAASYAAYVSNIYAWASDLDSESSAMQIPPVAPSNPYMALPKHRSVKHVSSSSMTGSPSSRNSSETGGATSEQEVSTALEKLPLLSATYQSWPSPSSAKAQASSLGVPPPQAVSSALRNPTSTANEEGPYENCDQDIVIDQATTTRDADTNFSHSIQTSGESASSAPLPTQRANSLDLNDASLPASAFSSLETSGRGLSGAFTPQASVGKQTSLARSATGLSTKTVSLESSKGSRISVARSGSLRWIGLGLTVFAVLNFGVE